LKSKVRQKGRKETKRVLEDIEVSRERAKISFFG
jgi:hypothetical protein